MLSLVTMGNLRGGGGAVKREVGEGQQLPGPGSSLSLLSTP